MPISITGLSSQLTDPDINDALAATDVSDITEAGSGTTKELSLGTLREFASTYVGITEVTGAATLANTDAFKLIVCNSATDFTVTLPATLNAAGVWIDVLNVGDGTVTVSAGTNGINVAGTDTMSVYTGDRKRLTYASATDPKWRADRAEGTAATVGNIIIGRDNGGTAEWVSEDFVAAFYTEMTGVNADNAPDGAADYAVVLDASAGTIKRVLLDNLPGSGGGGASALNDLSDVTLTNPQAGQVLKYNGTNFINDTDATGAAGTAGTITLEWPREDTTGVTLGNGTWVYALSIPFGLRITAVAWELAGTASADFSVLDDGTAVAGVNGLTVSGSGSTTAPDVTIAAGSTVQVQLANVANADAAVIELTVEKV